MNPLKPLFLNRMETNKLNKTLLWITLILFAINLSMAISFLYHRNEESGETKKEDTDKTDLTEELRGRTFRDQLNLRPEQMDPFREFTRSYNQNANGISRKLEEMRINMVAELGKENSDTALLRLIARNIGEEHTRLKDLTIRYYQSLNKMCSSEQRGKLNAIFMSTVNKTEEGKYPQQGGGRHRYGRQQNQ